MWAMPSRVDAGLDEAWRIWACDAQTSGGLLIAVPMERWERLRQELTRREAGAFVIGRVVGGEAGTIIVRTGNAENEIANIANRVERNQPMKNDPSETGAHGEGCCADVFGAGAAGSTVADSQKAFGELMRSVQAPGVLDAKTKELILFSLVVASRCEPCFEVHSRKARKWG